MKLQLALSLALTGLSACAFAAVTSEEAAELGKSLTPWGAIQAGNAEGTIPAYEGGLRQAPAGFKPDSGFWVDPFKDEKPLFRITAANAEQYADQLSEGQKELLRKNPDTWYMDIYPSHRTTAYPQEVVDATIRNATTCKIEKDGLAVSPDCRGGLPFPIPKTGNEVMWNQQLRYKIGPGYSTTRSSNSWVIDSNGQVTKVAEQATFEETPYYQVTQADRDPQMYARVYSRNDFPARRSGEVIVLNDYLDPQAKPRRSFSYTPGQRRVKLAPEFAFDTPVASQGGVTLFDELQMFSGAQTRFDYKLVGRKEMYIPYNAYKAYFDCKQDEQFLKNHANPACERWELHRVWVVEATLKPGQRHVYSKRTYYLDEDTFGIGLYDAWDKSGALYRAIFLSGVQIYDKTIPYNVKNFTYDFNKGNYALLNDALKGGYWFFDKPFTEREMNPEAIVSRVTQR
ncbi:DUF1329 domain-containing protein [Pseudomonas aeruginosa]|uniref:Uncharacterized protein n=1 Tax=Pseudomonas paraeruginosa TaxID=2994495 RepID=A0A2R3IP66_9PSED|nr:MULTISPECIES: DUF1329 domain-containing protein [Pseudomonas]VTS61812.1 Protein of uncharacterised function (DUF1329) [Streptococcus dysgalactiae subsp. equisimilis]AVK03427.1 hypothetical protein CSB93_6022 [Pseudomonas paraeruginosa]AWE93461.1 hypothetical protein CSC28_4821 [Pseudomonas paraeruginosa]ELL4387747.1 DUF1329 domain-containing protein [Pseudomonas aeruginosa]KAA5670793.1 DUF1329 domain-containing protein [Pseudomonas aeruginosa]